MHKKFIDTIIYPNFTPIADCVLSDDGAAWRFAKNVLYQRIVDKFNWVYVVLIADGHGVELAKIGGTGAVDGMRSRMNSYQSGNPKYNQKNGAQNRAVYAYVYEALVGGASVSVFGYQIPELEIKIDINIPWNCNCSAVSLRDVQLYKPFEKNLITLFESTTGAKPRWNVYAN